MTDATTNAPKTKRTAAAVAPVLSAEELAQLQALEMQAEVAEDAGTLQEQLDEALASAAPETTEDDGAATFSDLLASVTPDETQERMLATAKAFDDRAEFERDKNPANDNIQKTLKKVRTTFQGPLVAACMCALEMSPGFVNQAERSNARRNVYGLEKVGDLLKALAVGVGKNAVNIAVVRSMIALEKVGIPFTSAHALAATSDKVAIEPDAAKIMTRHTVSANTASTQTSSTMTALQEIGAVENIGTAQRAVYRFTSHPVVERLKEVFGK